jgi:peptidoglycan/xylan/chitin deacetylase (PgdA/CDA1 family)
MKVNKNLFRFLLPITLIAILLGVGVSVYLNSNFMDQSNGSNTSSDKPKDKKTNIFSIVEEKSNKPSTPKKIEPSKFINTDPTKFQLDIPVLTYHHISTLPADLENDAIAKGLRVSPAAFENQMKTLKDKGYTTLNIEDYEKITIGDKPMPKLPILLTLDDGYTDNYENAFPILKKYGLIGNFAIITDVLSTREYMSLDNVKELQKAGMGIISHTTLHCQLAQKTNGVYLDNLPGDTVEPCPQFTYPGGLTIGQADYELKESKAKLEKELNINVNSVVYPYGNYNKKTLELDKKNGYKFGFTTKGSVTPMSFDTTLLELPRITVAGQQTPELRGFFYSI